MRIRNAFPFIYLVLFAIYAPLTLLSSNLAEISVDVVLRPLGVCLLLGILIFLIFWLILRNMKKACLIASMFLLLFFSYGHFYAILDGVNIAGISIGKNRFLLPLFGLITILLVFLGLKWKKPPEWTHSMMLIIGLVLVVVPMFNIGNFMVAEARSRNAEKVLHESINNIGQAPSGVVTPDVYYIILDSYTRQDALKSDLKYDNSAFIGELKKIGFVVPECSRSNYPATIFSMSSSLNMDYLEKLNPDLLSPNGRNEMLVKLFRNPTVRSEFSKNGYKWVAIDTGRKGLEMDDADVFIQPEKLSKYLAYKEMINDFEDLLLKTTPGIVIANFGDRLFGGVYDVLRFPFYEHAAYQLFDIDALQKTTEITGPKFVYSHIMLPHYPYMFKADGSLQTNPDYLYEPIPVQQAIEGYGAQVTYINSRILPVIKTIIASSKVPPIIILQGDHGMGGKNRLKNLEAYFLPESLRIQIYPTFTPVNTFRLILNGLFDRGLPLLDDKSYSVTGKYIFTQVNEDNPDCIANK